MKKTTTLIGMLLAVTATQAQTNLPSSPINMEWGGRTTPMPSQ